MSRYTENANSGCNISLGGLPTILTIIFVIAKIVGYIDWSWWWVFSPVLITAGIVITVLLLWLILCFIIACINRKRY